MSSFIFPIFCFILSLVIGRFLHYLVLFYEGRKRIPFWKCPGCFYFLNTMPLFSYFVNKGACKRCLRKIHFEEPLTEFLTAFFITLIFILMPEGFYRFELALFTLMALAASSVDIKRTLLPDTCTIGGCALALVGAWLNPEREFMQALLGMMGAAGFLLFCSLFYYFIRRKEGMGGGDIKMIAWIGALTDFQSSFFILMIASLIGAFFGIYSFIRNKGKGVYELAFGPYLAFSTYIFILFQEI